MTLIGLYETAEMWSGMRELKKQWRYLTVTSLLTSYSMFLTFAVGYASPIRYPWGKDIDHKTIFNSTSMNALVWLLKPLTEAVTLLAICPLKRYVNCRILFPFSYLMSILSLVFVEVSYYYWLTLLCRAMLGLCSGLFLACGLTWLEESYGVQTAERLRADAVVFSAKPMGTCIGLGLTYMLGYYLSRPVAFLPLASLFIVLLTGGFLMKNRANRPTTPISTTEYDRITFELPNDMNLNPLNTEAESPLTFGLLLRTGRDLIYSSSVFIAVLNILLPSFAMAVTWGTSTRWALTDLRADSWDIGKILLIAGLVQIIIQLNTSFYLFTWRWKIGGLGLSLTAVGLLLYPICHDIEFAIGPESVIRIGSAVSYAAVIPYTFRLLNDGPMFHQKSLYYIIHASESLGIAAGFCTGLLTEEILGVDWLYRIASLGILLVAFTGFVFAEQSAIGPTRHSGYRPV